jgi:hypothetical protein
MSFIIPTVALQIILNAVFKEQNIISLIVLLLFTVESLSDEFTFKNCLVDVNNFRHI